MKNTFMILVAASAAGIGAWSIFKKVNPSAAENLKNSICRRKKEATDAVEDMMM